MLPLGESRWVCRRDRQTDGWTPNGHISLSAKRSERNKPEMHSVIHLLPAALVAGWCGRSAVCVCVSVCSDNNIRTKKLLTLTFATIIYLVILVLPQSQVKVQGYRKTRKMCSRIDMQTHNGRLGLGFYLWPFDLRVSACRGPVMDYMSADFGADSSSHFPFRTRTNRQTNRQTWLNVPYPTPAAIQQAWLTTALANAVRMVSVYCTLLAASNERD